MSRDHAHITAPVPEQEPALPIPGPSQLPADGNNAQQEGLLQSELNKKKSWFSSVRHALSRSALHAKSAVDQLRGEPGGRSYVDDADEYEDRAQGSKNGASSSRNVSSAGDFIAPRRADDEECQKPSTPKTAISSLPAQIYHSIARRDRRKLGAMAGNSVTEENPTRDPVGPEALVGDLPVDHEAAKMPVGTTRGHGRRASMARSLVGSLRTLTRRGTQSPKCDSPTKGTQDDEGTSPAIKQASALLLPSSPIDIPAPNLDQLDLSPVELMSSSFMNSPQIEQPGEMLALTASSPRTFDNMPAYSPKLFIEDVFEHQLSTLKISDGEDLQPSELLERPVDEFGSSLSDEACGSGSFLPGISLRMDLDGSNGRIAVFERSVESKTSVAKQENKKLKKMGSIDALADQCARERSSPRDSEVNMPLQPRTAFKKSTSGYCPSDTPSMIRHTSPETPILRARSAGTGTGQWQHDPNGAQWRGDDVFASAAAGSSAGSGTLPPSITLPLRPKIRVQSVDGSQPRTIDISPDTLEDEEEVLVALSAFPKVQAEVDLETRPNILIDNSGSKPDRSVSETPSRNSLCQLQDTKKIVRKESTDEDSVDTTATPQRLLSSTDRAIKSNESKERGQAGAQESPVAPSLCRFTSRSETSNQRGNRPDTAHSPDMGTVFWKQVTWRNHNGESQRCDGCRQPIQRENESQGPCAGNPNIQYPPGQGAEPPDVGSIPIDESRATPPLSPGNTGSNRSPSMGDRLDFDARRSERNMRYNALTRGGIEVSPNKRYGAVLLNTQPSRRPALTLLTEGLANNAIEETNVSDSENQPDSYSTVAVPPARELMSSSLQHHNELSSDNIEPELHEALQDNYVFQVAMSGLDLPYSPARTPALAPVSSLFSSYQGGVRAAESGYAALGTSPSSLKDSASSSGSTGPSNYYNFETRPRENEAEKRPDVEVSPDEADLHAQGVEDSLDDALEIYKSYSVSQHAVDEGVSFRQRWARCEKTFESSSTSSDNEPGDTMEMIKQVVDQDKGEMVIAAEGMTDDPETYRFQKLVDGPGSPRKSRSAGYHRCKSPRP